MNKSSHDHYGWIQNGATERISHEVVIIGTTFSISITAVVVEYQIQEILFHLIGAGLIISV